MSLAIRLIVIALAMTAFLVVMVARHTQARTSGYEIILDMEPVDPRDLLLGYYVIIRTPVHNLDTGALDGPQTGWREGDRAFVRLAETGTGSVEPIGVYRQRPEDGVFLQGRVSSANTRWDWAERDNDPVTGEWRPRERIEGTQRQTLRIHYNLERYFADAAQAQALENLRNEDRIRLIVSLDRNGLAVIKGLEIDGVRQLERLN